MSSGLSNLKIELPKSVNSSTNMATKRDAFSDINTIILISIRPLFQRYLVLVIIQNLNKIFLYDQNDWVCGQSWKLFFVHTIYWTGSLFGVYFIGSIADKYGRVPAIALCHLISGIAGIATVFFANHFAILLISRAFMGFVVLSQGMFAVVLVMEFVGIDGRMIISTLFLLSYSITATFLPWIAYYIHNWRILSVITSVPLLIVPVLCLSVNLILGLNHQNYKIN